MIKQVVFLAFIGFAYDALAQKADAVVVEIVAPSGSKLSFGVDEILRMSIQGNKREREIRLQVDSITGKAFGKLTYDNVGEPIIIRVCGKQASSPVIRDPIFGGEMAMSGFAKDEVGEIYDVLSGRRSCHY